MEQALHVSCALGSASPRALPPPGLSGGRRKRKKRGVRVAAAGRNTNPKACGLCGRPETCWVLPVTEAAPRQPRAHTPAQGRPGMHRTHLAAAEDVGRGDAHVEMLEHGLCLLPGLEGAVHGHAAPSPDLGPELHASGAVGLQA